MMNSDKSESSAFVNFKFAPNVIRHLPPDSLLNLKPSILYEINQRIQTVKDVISSLREEFTIPINIMIIMEKKDALLLPRLPVKVLTYRSTSFRVESAEAPRKAISLVDRARRAVSGMKIFPDWSSNLTSSGRKRSAENPAPSHMAPAKRQRASTATEDPTNSAFKDAEENAENIALENAIQPEVDSLIPESLPSGSTLSRQVDRTSVQLTSTSQQTLRRVSGAGNKKRFWSLAKYEDVQANQIIQLTVKAKDGPGQFTCIMNVIKVEENKITGFYKPCLIGLGLEMFEVNKSKIEDIKILVDDDGEVVYDNNVV